MSHKLDSTWVWILGSLCLPCYMQDMAWSQKNITYKKMFSIQHPGGEESLLDVAGQDGSQGFDDVGHSDDARLV